MKKVFTRKQKHAILREQQKKNASKSKNQRETFLFTRKEVVGYSQNSKNRPVRHRDQNTYKITHSRNKFIIYKLDRKEKPVRIKTVKKSKNNKNKNDIANNVQNGKLKLHSKHESDSKFRSGKTNVVQSSNKPREKNKGYQLVGLVDVTDTRRNITDEYIAFSNKIRFKNDSVAYGQMEKMAVAKFVKDYGYPRKTEDIIANVKEETIRYQYWNYKEKI